MAKPDLTGSVFNRLTVIKKVPRKATWKQQQYWECQCSCGNTVILCTNQLTSGHTQSCGCLHRDRTIALNYARIKDRKDLTGQKFSRLTVVGNLDDTPRGKCFWVCKCDCGNEKILSYPDLVNGTIKSCGCLLYDYSHSYKRTNFADITGNRFGKLTVLEETPKRRGKNVVWKCICDCGNSTEATQGALRSGEITSCGLCNNNSKGELKISQILNDCGMPFVHEATFESCRFPDTNASFKNEWCLQNDIPIIRIPYDHYKNISKEDLVPETSRYLVNDASPHREVMI